MESCMISQLTAILQLLVNLKRFQLFYYHIYYFAMSCSPNGCPEEKPIEADGICKIAETDKECKSLCTKKPLFTEDGMCREVLYDKDCIRLDPAKPIFDSVLTCRIPNSSEDCLKAFGEEKPLFVDNPKKECIKPSTHSHCKQLNPDF